MSITDAECTRFLQEALPRLRLRWPGFRKVRGLVCKRIGKRLRELRLADLSADRAYLEAHGSEWEKLDGFCRIPISRLYRDRAVFEDLEHEALPALATAARVGGRSEVICWSAACASGEEPYTLVIVWQLRLAPMFPALKRHVIATDIDAKVIARAGAGCYQASSLKELPRALFDQAFVERGEEFCVREAFRTVEFLQQDIRSAAPHGTFDVVLCRNSVLTYFAPELQRVVMEHAIERLRPGGALVVGFQFLRCSTGAAG